MDLMPKLKTVSIPCLRFIKRPKNRFDKHAIENKTEKKVFGIKQAIRC